MLAPLLSSQPPEFPFVALLVSGGHTQLMAAHGIGQYELLGSQLMMRRVKLSTKSQNDESAVSRWTKYC